MSELYLPQPCLVYGGPHAQVGAISEVAEIEATRKQRMKAASAYEALQSGLSKGWCHLHLGWVF